MEEYIWYACYGSNINRERFLCYIDGKERTICGKSIKNKGCDDKSPPREDHPFVFNHDIYFAKTSTNWGGGVAFIDLDNPGSAYGRIYLVTKQQFDKIKEQEGSWYSRQSNSLGERDGYKIYTFTDIKREKYIPPSDCYKQVIIQGLMETGLSKEMAKEYIEKRIKELLTSN